MKKYVFANFYLSGMKWMAIFVIIFGLFLSSPHLVNFKNYNREISVLLQQPLANVNINAVIQQLNFANDSLLTNNPNFSSVKLLIDKIPWRNQGIWIGKQAYDAKKSLQDSQTAVTLLKDHSLQGFLNNIDPIIEGTKSRVSQLEGSSSLPTVIRPTITNAFDENLLFDRISSDVLRFYDGILPSIISFLSDDIRYYTPSQEARSLAGNALAQLKIFEPHIESLRRSKQPTRIEQSTTRRPEISSRDRDERQIASDFYSNLISIRSAVIENHTNHWSIDRTISNMLSSSQLTISNLENLRNQRNSSIFDFMKSLFGGILLALLLLILRDFLSAAIDTAKNTNKISEQLSDVNVAYE